MNVAVTPCGGPQGCRFGTKGIIAMETEANIPGLKPVIREPREGPAKPQRSNRVRLRLRIPERDLGVPRPSRVDGPAVVARPALVPSLDVDELPELPQRLKTGIDRFLAANALLVLSPLLLAVALAIKLDSRGPVVFRQKRHGQNMELFTIYKFRTMRVEEEADGFVQATREDERVTRLGRLLRRASLDELPQFYNVLRGDMSLVGPRPHPVALDTRYVAGLDNYTARYSVKPGITGWAQINGHRGPTEVEGSMEARLDRDLYYIENWSLGLDLKILLITPFLGLFGKNAF